MYPEGSSTSSQHISPSEQREGVSVLLTDAGTRPPFKLSTEQLKRPGASCHLVYKPRRGLAQTDSRNADVSTFLSFAIT